MSDLQQKFSQIRDVAAESIHRHRVPGAAIGIFIEGEQFFAGLGVTNARHPLPVNEHTLFQIGSTTKTFTATLAMRLVEQGKLDLDAPVRRYLPEFRMQDRDVTERVSMRHLFTHIGGWEGDFFEDTGNGDDALQVYVERMSSLPQLTPLGTVWSYNNSAFSLAGRVIEALGGSSYESQMTEQVLRPLGLKRSFIVPAEVMTHRFAVGHATTETDQIVLRPWLLARSAFPAGGITSSVEDQIRYARFHLGDKSVAGERPPISANSIALMQREQGPGMFDAKMGIAWMLDNVEGLKAVAHGGGTNGQISTFVMIPERQFAISVLTNSGTGGLFAADVHKCAFEQLLGVAPREPQTIEVPADALGDYEGTYRATLTEVGIKLVDENLTIQLTSRGGFPTKDTPAGPPGPRVRVGFTQRDRLIALDPPLYPTQAEFLRDSSGKIAWLRLGARIHRPL